MFSNRTEVTISIVNHNRSNHLIVSSDDFFKVCKNFFKVLINQIVLPSEIV